MTAPFFSAPVWVVLFAVKYVLPVSAPPDPASGLHSMEPSAATSIQKKPEFCVIG